MPTRCRAHFALPASVAFVREATALAVDPPELSIYEAQPLLV